jgi:hypothetical protein
MLLVYGRRGRDADHPCRAACTAIVARDAASRPIGARGGAARIALVVLSAAAA